MNSDPAATCDRAGSVPVFGLILAAGGGTRFGGGKLLAPLPDGRPVAAAVAAALEASRLDEIVAVVAPGDGALSALFRDRGFRVAENPDPSREMGSSLATGASAVLALARAVRESGLLVALGDMPWIATDLVDGLAAAYRRLPGRIVVPVRGGRRGHPVVFPLDLADELRALGGETGGRAILAAHPARILELPVETDAIFRDVDTPADLAAGETGS